ARPRREMEARLVVVPSKTDRSHLSPSLNGFAERPSAPHLQDAQPTLAIGDAKLNCFYVVGAIPDVMVEQADGEAYVIDGHTVDMRRAPMERAWMDATDQRFAYRCLPLNIADAHGWEILAPSGFSAYWDGRTIKEAVHITPDPGATSPVISHFGHGVLTFHVPCLFRTEPGVDLLATTPLNLPTDGLAPLTS